MRENLQWIHVPFTGGTECTAAILGGHVEGYSAALGAELEQIRAGRLRVLLSLNPKRVSLFPDVPSVLEKGYDFAIMSGGCWTVPAGTPKDIQRKLENALLQAFKDPTVIDALNKWNWAIDPLDSESLTNMIGKDYRINGELLKKFGLGIYKKG
jgi:tripartite-type tricarboxylate transporter receptor subunit TctC